MGPLKFEGSRPDARHGTPQIPISLFPSLSLSLSFSAPPLVVVDIFAFQFLCRLIYACGWLDVCEYLHVRMLMCVSVSLYV